MPLGWKNPLPFKLGGRRKGSTLDTYLALRRTLGENGAPPEDGLEDLWIKAEARGISLAQSAVRAAFNQFFPRTMTSALGRWESKLGLPMAKYMIDRQRNVAAAITAQADASTPGLREGLRKIDHRFDILHTPWAQVVTVMFGKSFGPLAGVAGPVFRTGIAAAIFGQSSMLSNYSDSYIVHVQYVLDPGQTQIDPAIYAAAADFLCNALPCNFDFAIFTLSDGDDGPGWYLDGGVDGTSLLDQTAFY
jgi:hypothetical protein